MFGNMALQKTPDINSLSPKNMRDASSGVKLKIALFGELSLEEAMDLSRDRQILEVRRSKDLKLVMIRLSNDNWN
jgi:hypothetical protein